MKSSILYFEFEFTRSKFITLQIHIGWNTKIDCTAYRDGNREQGIYGSLRADWSRCTFNWQTRLNMMYIHSCMVVTCARDYYYLPIPASVAAIWSILLAIWRWKIKDQNPCMYSVEIGTCFDQKRRQRRSIDQRRAIEANWGSRSISGGGIEGEDPK